MFRRDSRALDGLFEDDHGSSAARLDPAIQISGHLYKKATSGKPSWKRRLVVIKDGFLLYYNPIAPEGDPHSEEAVTLHRFDVHPKGVLPLDGTSVARVDDGPTKSQRNSLAITHPSFGGRALVLCAETPETLTRWMDALEGSKFVTYENALAGAQSIEKLKQEKMGLRTQVANATTEIRELQSDIESQRDQLLQLQSAASKLLLGFKALKAHAESTGTMPSRLPFEAELDEIAATIGAASLASPGKSPKHPPGTHRSSVVSAIALPPPTEATEPASGEPLVPEPMALPPPPPIRATVEPTLPPPPPLVGATTLPRLAPRITKATDEEGPSPTEERTPADTAPADTSHADATTAEGAHDRRRNRVKRLKGVVQREAENS
jgi:hypothetical protein